MPPNGRIVVPAAVRRRLGLEQGGELMIFENEDGGLELRSRLQAVREIQKRYRELIGDRPGSSVDDLIAERRREAALEH